MQLETYPPPSLHNYTTFHKMEVQEESSEQVKKRTCIEERMTSAVVMECCSCKRQVFKEDGLCNLLTCGCDNQICYGCGWQARRLSNGRRRLHVRWPRCFRGEYDPGGRPTHLIFAAEEAGRARREMDKEMPGTSLVHDPAEGMEGFTGGGRRAEWVRFVAGKAVVAAAIAVAMAAAANLVASPPRLRAASRTMTADIVLDEL